MSGNVGFANAPFRSLTWKAVLFHIVTFPIAIFYFVLTAVGISLSVGLLVIGVGFLIGYGVLWLIHGMAPVEARFVSRLLETPMRASLPEPEGSFLQRYLQMLTSPSTWSRIGYVAVKLVVAVVGFGFAVGGVAALASIATPFLYTQEWFSADLGIWEVDTQVEAVVSAILGLVVAWVFLYFSLLLGRLTAVLARAMVSDPLYGSGRPPQP